MVNFRFHLVSLIAVFLALALGIGMGATVIDKATVDQLQQRLNNVRTEVEAANQRSDQLQIQLNRLNDFETRAAPYIVDDSLDDQSVVIVAIRGTDGGAVTDTANLIKTAGAGIQGTLWFTGRSALSETDAANDVRESLDVESQDSSQVRQAMLARVSAVFAGASPPSSITTLADAGIIEWQGDSVADLAAAQFPGTRLVVVSSANPEASNDLIARPLVRQLAAQPSIRTVVAEPGRDADARTSAERTVFLGPLRSDGDVASRISTVDNLESAAGRVSVVLALSQLPERRGHYGVGEGSQGLLPAFEE